MLSGPNGGFCLADGLLGIYYVWNRDFYKASHYFSFRPLRLMAGNEVFAAIPVHRECSGPAALPPGEQQPVNIE
jgi:hypothetical protein